MSTRREFIKTSCLACSAAILASVTLDSCVTRSLVTVIQTNKDELLVPVAKFTNDKGEQLTYLVVQTSTLPYSVSLYKIAEGYSALKLVCTHNHCDLNANKERLVCPCHGSEFDKAGKVLTGPANTNLVRYEVKEESGNITIYLKKILG